MSAKEFAMDAQTQRDRITQNQKLMLTFGGDGGCGVDQTGRLAAQFTSQDLPHQKWRRLEQGFRREERETNPQ